jgi:hypothetical protein
MAQIIQVCTESCPGDGRIYLENVDDFMYLGSLGIESRYAADLIILNVRRCPVCYQKMTLSRKD